MKKLGYVPYGTYNYRNPAYPFHNMFTAHDVSNGNVKDMDAVVIWGGADIPASMYSEFTSNHSACYEGQWSKRDKAEATLFLEAVEYGIPIIGVCRGAQLACALSDGKLVQHVDHHAGSDHNIVTNDGRILSTSSVHHQMMYPFDIPHEMLAWSAPSRSQRYYGAKDSMMDCPVEPEVVWFPTTKALAIQGHPEFMDEKCEFNDYIRELISQYILTTAEQHAQSTQA